MLSSFSLGPSENPKAAGRILTAVRASTNTDLGVDSVVQLLLGPNQQPRTSTHPVSSFCFGADNMLQGAPTWE